MWDYERASLKAKNVIVKKLKQKKKQIYEEMKKGILAKRLKKVMLKTVMYKSLTAKSSPTPAVRLSGKTRRVSKEQRYLSTLLEQMDDDDATEHLLCFL